MNKKAASGGTTKRETKEHVNPAAGRNYRIFIGGWVVDSTLGPSVRQLHLVEEKPHITR